MSQKFAPSTAVSTIGIDLGKNSFHLVGLDLRLKCVLSTEAKSKADREPQPNGFWDDLPMVPRFIAWVINAERYTTVPAALSPHAVAEETASRALCVTSTNCYAWNTLIDQPWIMSIARRNWVAAGHSF